MAEFVDVMRQAKRMCAAHGGMCKIRNCPMVNGEACRFAADQDNVDYNEVERIIMDWAAEHPAPRYPTWREWQNSTFPNRHRDVSPCEFDDARRFNCALMKCDECMDEPIPADIAAKLGIKPINEGCENCKYTDKAEDEEPCVRCRHTQPEGSARWTEMSDLWEEAQDE
nr:MAG TPA: hypothetical protein [Caudoviricetes sp.]